MLHSPTSKATQMSGNETSTPFHSISAGSVREGGETVCYLEARLIFFCAFAALLLSWYFNSGILLFGLSAA